MKVKVKATLTCLTLCDPVDYKVHGIPQARLLEWVAFPFSRGSSQPRDRTQVSYISLRWQEGSLSLGPPGKPTNCYILNSIQQNSRDITLPTKVCTVKAMVFPVVMYRCERWTIKKAEHWRIDAFKLWCWRRLWRVPWTARRTNQSFLMEINPEYSLEGLILKLKLKYFGHLWRADSLEKTLMLGKIEGKRMRWLDSITNSIDVHLSKL